MNMPLLPTIGAALAAISKRTCQEVTLIMDTPFVETLLVLAESAGSFGFLSVFMGKCREKAHKALNLESLLLPWRMRRTAI